MTYCIVSFITGFQGGLAYMTSFMMLFENMKIETSKKDICIIITAISFTCSVLTASLFGYVFNLIF